MSHRPPRRSRAYLDDVLDGRSPAGDPLADLVALARAPAPPSELGGLDAALTAFMAAPNVAPYPEEKTPMLKRVAGRVLALKLLALAAGTAAAGGVAYAAVNGNLDSPNSNSAAVAGASSGAPSSGAASSSGDDSSSSSSSASDSGSSSEPSESGSSSASSSSSSAALSPSLRGLCTAWFAHPKNDAKLSTNPAYSVLVRAAGDVGSVNGYCVTVLAGSQATESASESAKPHPTHPTHPAHPTQAQNTKSKSTHPTHPAHPTQAQNTKSPNPHKTH